MDIWKNSPFKISMKGEKFRSPVKSFTDKVKNPVSGKYEKITSFSTDTKKQFNKLSKISKNLTLSRSGEISETLREDLQGVLKSKGQTSLASLKVLLKDQLFGKTFTREQKEGLKKDIALFSQLRLGVLGKKFSNEQLLQAIKNAATLIWDMLKDLEEDGEEEDLTTELLGILMDLHSSYTFAHSNRVTDLSLALAEEIGLTSESEMNNLKKAAFFKDIGQYGPDDLSFFPGQKNEKIKEYIDEIHFTLKECGNLHDIGKMRVPNSILNKKGPLTDEEYNIIKDHPLIGVEIVSLFPPLHGAIPGIKHHHERWDGNGYPDKKKGNSIPLQARIISISDSFDAMTSKRPYRKPISCNRAIHELINCSGTQFDPELIPPFIYALEKKGEIEPGEFEVKIKKLEIKFNFNSERR